MLLSITTVESFASEYDDYVEEINSKYNLEIIKKDGVENNCNLEKFKQDVDSIVESQLYFRKKEAEYKIRKNNNFFLINSKSGYSTITQTKNSSSAVFKITATFDYYNGTPKNVRNFRNISYSYSTNFTNAGFLPSSGYPQVSIIDSGRTGVVKYVGLFTNSGFTLRNYMFSAEFYSP